MQIIKSKLLKRVLGTLVIAIIVFIGAQVILSLLGGRDDEFYQSVWGFGLTPFGIAVTLLLVVIVATFSRLTTKSDKQIEKDLADYVASKQKDKG